MKDNERAVIFAYSGYFNKYSTTKNFQNSITEFAEDFSGKLKNPQDMTEIYNFCKRLANEAQEMGFKQGTHYKD